MYLCDTGTAWDTCTTIKRCKCDSTGANTQPSRTDIKDMYNNGGNCNADGTITLCGTGTAWNSTIKRCKCDSTEAPAAAPTCDGSAITELNGDGIVNVQDLLKLLAHYGGDGGFCDEGSADTNNDGTVNVADLMNVLDDFGGGGNFNRSCTEFCPTNNINNITTDGNPSVPQVSTDGAGTTWRLSYTLANWQKNIYAIYGDEEHDLSMPPSYQEAAPFGANSGGVNPAFIAVNAGAEFDGWLTVGITEGDNIGEISSIGVDFDTWTADAGLSVTNGAVFWMSPDDGDGGRPDQDGNREVVLAQVTLSGSFNATMKVRGRSNSGLPDWCRKLTFAA